MTLDIHLWLPRKNTHPFLPIFSQKERQTDKTEQQTKGKKETEGRKEGEREGGKK